MQTIVRRVVVVVMTILVVMAAAGPVDAASSAVSGWWTTSPVPLAPDVSAEQLLVQGGPDSALAYAGVSFELTAGERPHRVVLLVAPSSATTPASRLALCPLRSPALTESGAPAAEGPAFDCATKVEAVPAADGSTYTFDVSSLPFVASLDLAVLPTAPTDRVVLGKPGADALQSESSPAVDAQAGSPLPSPLPVFDVLTDAFAPTFGGATATAAAPGPAGTTPVATETAAPAANAGASFPVAGGEGGASMLAALLFTVLAAAAVGLWAVAGRRAPPSTA
jgi:hypothetical protein